MSHALDDVTGAVLAGGRGLRMGGQDKGLVPHAGRPLVAHVLEALRPQVRELMIIANRNPDRYAGFGAPVHPDSLPGFQGPLAGILTALERAKTPLVLCVPCDTPALPADLARRLHAALESAGADAAVAHDGVRMHPVICLLRRSLARRLAHGLEAGERRVQDWLGQQRLALADFSDAPQRFENFNTLEQLRARQPAAEE